MNTDILKGKWKQLKGRVRTRWGKLTDDDLDVIDGHLDRLIGRIQERYGEAREKVRETVESWLEREQKGGDDKGSARKSA